jgi:hypothetical protein
MPCVHQWRQSCVSRSWAGEFGGCLGVVVLGTRGAAGGGVLLCALDP